MHKYQKETESILLKHEKEAFNQLRNSYAQALADTKKMVKELTEKVEALEKADLENKSILRSKIYQLKYQMALESQLTATMDILNDKKITNVQTFLNKMYEDGYLSINYHLQKQGIPIITPINPSLMVRVVNTPVEKMTFSKRLYKNTQQLKKSVKSEISRGIATGKSYNEIAKQLEMVTEADFNKSYRIVRTEGGRVSSNAKLTSMRDAREKGADLVKQWDSTLDGRTRYTHAKLDQQIREIDEPFEVDGMTAMCPHGFGRPDMDVNCRCVMLSVPRWDIQEENERYDNISQEIVKVKDYETWKNQYYSDDMFKYMDYVDSKYRKYETRNFTTMLNSLSNTEYKNFTDKMNNAYGIMKNITKNNGNINHIKYLNDELLEVDEILIKESQQRLIELTNKFPKIQRYIEENDVILGAYYSNNDEIARTQGSMLTGNKMQKIALNKKYYIDYDRLISEEKENILTNWSMPCDEKYFNVYTLTHEYGHMIHNILMKDYVEKNIDEFNKFKDRLYKADISRQTDMIKKYQLKIIEGYMQEVKEIALRKDPKFLWKTYLSDYGKTNYAEAFAEAFANSQCGKSNVLGDAMSEFLEERLK